MIVKQYSTPQATAEGIITELLIPLLNQGIGSFAVSGGSTPKLLFELMGSPAYRDRIKWDNLRLYWVDERCVPPTDIESNYGMTVKALDIKALPLDIEHIYRIQGEQDPEREAERYTALVKEQLPLSPKGLPIFDLILLGIGDDGHTSSIFPHQMRLLEETIPYVVAQSPKGQNRICLTGQTILEARAVAFHAVGAGKQEILRQIVSLSPQSKAYPSSYFAEQRADILLYTDQAI